MKIAVCVKQVPDATSVRRLDPATNRLDRSGEGALNATDLNAVEEALRIKEAHGGEVVVVSLGPAKALDSMRKALAMGADRAVLVSDEAAAGSDLVATSYALAKALERESADLVLFGQQSSDSDGAVLWGAVADRLRRPLISQVAELGVDGASVTGKRQTEFGYDVIPRRCRPWSRSRTRSTSRATRRSRGSWAPSRSRPRRSRSPTSASRPTGPARAARAPPSSRWPAAAEGRQVKIEDDGTAAEQLVDWLAERKLL